MTGDDRVKLIERSAAALWQTRDDLPWADAGPHWQPIYREMAEVALAVVAAG